MNPSKNIEKGGGVSLKTLAIIGAIGLANLFTYRAEAQPAHIINTGKKVDPYEAQKFVLPGVGKVATLPEDTIQKKIFEKENSVGGGPNLGNKMVLSQEMSNKIDTTNIGQVWGGKLLGKNNRKVYGEIKPKDINFSGPLQVPPSLNRNSFVRVNLEELQPTPDGFYYILDAIPGNGVFWALKIHKDELEGELFKFEYNGEWYLAFKDCDNVLLVAYPERAKINPGPKPKGPSEGVPVAPPEGPKDLLKFMGGNATIVADEVSSIRKIPGLAIVEIQNAMSGVKMFVTEHRLVKGVLEEVKVVYTVGVTSLGNTVVLFPEMEKRDKNDPTPSRHGMPNFTSFTGEKTSAMSETDVLAGFIGQAPYIVIRIPTTETDILNAWNKASLAERKIFSGQTKKIVSTFSGEGFYPPFKN